MVAFASRQPPLAGVENVVPLGQPRMAEACQALARAVARPCGIFASTRPGQLGPVAAYLLIAGLKPLDKGLVRRGRRSRPRQVERSGAPCKTAITSSETTAVEASSASPRGPITGA